MASTQHKRQQQLRTLESGRHVRAWCSWQPCWAGQASAVLPMPYYACFDVSGSGTERIVNHAVRSTEAGNAQQRDVAGRIAALVAADEESCSGAKTHRQALGYLRMTFAQ